MPKAALATQREELVLASPVSEPQAIQGRPQHPGWSVLRICSVIALDATLLGVGLALATALRLALIPAHFKISDAAPQLYLLCWGCWMGMFFYERIYAAGLQAADQGDQIVKALTGGLVIAVLISFATHQTGAVSRTVILGWFGANLALFMLLRPRLLRMVVQATRHELVLVVSDGSNTASALTFALAKVGFRSQQVSWTCDPESPALGTPAAVVVCLPVNSTDNERLSRWERRFPNLGIVPASSTAPFNARSVNLHGIQMFVLSHPLERWSNRAYKRLMDVAGASLLGLIASPLWLLLICAIKLESPGPVYFRQRRLGRCGRPFNVLKFRSMAADAEARLQGLLADDENARREYAATFKLKQDPRVTRVGRILRRYSLDEIPQLWNILRGEMSLVGPRPITDDEVTLYGEAYAVVASVRPGLTGIWQTSGRSDVTYESRLRFDLGYVRNWSISGDFALLLRTVAAVVSPHAY